MNDQSFNSSGETTIPGLNISLSSLPPKCRFKYMKLATDSNPENIAVKTDCEGVKVEQDLLDSNPVNLMPIDDDTPENSSDDDSNDDFDYSSNNDSDDCNRFKPDGQKYCPIDVSANRPLSEIVEEYCSGRRAKHVLAQFYRLSSNDRKNVRFKLIELICNWPSQRASEVDSNIFQFLDGFSCAVTFRNRDQIESVLSTLEDFYSDTDLLREQCERLARNLHPNLQAVKRSLRDNEEQLSKVENVFDKVISLVVGIYGNIQEAQDMLP